ncbi:hypothetical protein ABBQ38_008717 [Trebouxia sp. C0009 RCD-2024]
MAQSHVGIVALLACLCFASAVDHTHINNLSSKTICATTSYYNLDSFDREYYPTGSSQFVGRQITAGNSDVDEYTAVDQVRVEYWVLGDGGQNCDTATGKHSTAAIYSDDSMTTNNNADGQGVDVYNAGTNNQLQGLSFTVYGAPTFVARPTNEALPDQTRVATLQDVNNPNLDLSKVGLSSDSIAELVDGWIKGSDGNYATGTDDDQGFNTHLGIVDLSLPVGWTDGGYDAIPTSADPNGALTKRTDSDEDQVVPPLTKRAGFANANAAQTDTIKTLISMWTDSGLDASQRQGTLLTYQGFRIDQQLNGPVQRGANGDNYLQLAVQSGSNLYAAVMVPVGNGIAVSAGGIRKALYQSLADGTTYAFTRSPKKSWRWAIVLGAALLLIL